MKIYKLRYFEMGDNYDEYKFYNSSVRKNGYRIDIRNVMELLEDCIYVNDDYIAKKIKELDHILEKIKELDNKSMPEKIRKLKNFDKSNGNYCVFLIKGMIAFSDDDSILDQMNEISYKDWIIKGLIE